MKPKITTQILQRLEQEADKRLLLTPYKDIEIETGLKRGYIANIVHRMMRKKRPKKDSVVINITT